MKGHVFQCCNKGSNKNQFTKTVEALHEYIAKKITYPGDMWNLTNELKEPEVEKPDEMTEQELKDDHFKRAVWTRQVTNYVNRCDQLKQNMRAVATVIMAQCSEAMKAKLRSSTDFKERYDKADCVWLLTTIRSTMLKFEGHQYRYMALRDALAAISNHRQGDNTLTVYRDELANLVEEA